jgi:hypothetical protein
VSRHGPINETAPNKVETSLAPELGVSALSLAKGLEDGKQVEREFDVTVIWAPTSTV